MLLRLALIWSFLLGGLFPVLAIAQLVNGAELNMGSRHAFVEPDYSRGLIYVSFPDENRVALISMVSLTEVDEIVFDGNPVGLDLSNDGNTLYVGVSGTGTVASVDLTSANLDFTEIDVSAALTHRPESIVTATYDVEESAGNRLYFSADTGSGSFANLGFIDLTNGSVHKAGLSQSGGFFEIIRSNPRIISSSDGSRIYVSTDNNTYALDGTAVDVPVLFSSRVSYRRADFRFSSNESRLILGNGEVLFTSNLLKLDSYEDTRPFYSSTKPFDSDVSFIGYNIVSQVIQSFVSPYFNQPSYELTGVCSGCIIEDMVLDQSSLGIFVFDSSFPKIVYMSKDDDEDDVFDLVDNCAAISNSGQENLDGDKFGDACDDDIDGDGLANVVDPFPSNYDGDDDGIDDRLDQFPGFSGASLDTDRDGRPDEFFGDCDTLCQSESGLVADDDDDNDLIEDLQDAFPRVSETPASVFPSSLSLLGFDSEPAFFEQDKVRGRAYISFPDEFKVSIVSLEDLSEVYTLYFDGRPMGLSLSGDSEKLYVGIAGSGELIEIDLTSHDLSRRSIDISTNLGRTRPLPDGDVFDVLEINGKVFISGNGDSAKIIFVDTNNAYQVGLADRDVSFSRGINRNPLLSAHKNGEELLVQNSTRILRFDLTADGLPVIQRHEPALFQPRVEESSRGFHVSPSGHRIIAGNGQVFEGNQMEYLSDRYSFGVSAINPLGNKYTGYNSETSRLSEFDVNGLYEIGGRDNPCGQDLEFLPQASFIEYSQDESGWYIGLKEHLGNSLYANFKLCFYPRSEGFVDSDLLLGASDNPTSYFPLTPSVQRLFTTQETPLPEVIFQFREQTQEINGNNVHILESSANILDYYGVLDRAIHTYRRDLLPPTNEFLIYDPSVPITPKYMVVGANKTSSGTATLIESDGEVLIYNLDSEVEILAYENVPLINSQSALAYKIRSTRRFRTTDLSPTLLLTEDYWVSENLGFIKFFSNDSGQEFVSTLIDPSDIDRDGVHDLLDQDIDGDGVRNENDAFPNDPLETIDTDGDMIGNNSDEDDDNDLINDVAPDGSPLDNCPLIFNPGQEDADMDGIGDACEDDELCFPLITKSGSAAVICL